MIRSEWGKGNWRKEVQPRPPPNGSRGSREALTDIQEASWPSGRTVCISCGSILL